MLQYFDSESVNKPTFFEEAITIVVYVGARQDSIPQFAVAKGDSVTKTVPRITLTPATTYQPTIEVRQKPGTTEISWVALT